MLLRNGNKSSVWVLPQNLEPDPLISDICNAFPVVVEQTASKVQTWYDTFDWRLYRQGYFLYADENDWKLLRRNSEEAVASLNAGESGKRYFSWDFPPSRIRAILEPVIEMRSLLPLTKHQSSTTVLRILNNDDKTVAQVFLDRFTVPEHDAAFRTIRLEEIRGYGKEFDEVAGYFKSYGIKERAEPYFPFVRSLGYYGRKPLDYSSKLDVKLPSEFSARSAMVHIYKHLLEVMVLNLSGILDDLDSEFLHDFRVAVRRTRSGLGQLKGVLPDHIVQKAKEDFSWLGKVTGPTRDLDVYLLYEENYRSRLPSGLQEGLDILFSDIRSRREKEFEKLVMHMQSGRFKHILDDWHDYLYGEHETGDAENAMRPAVELAGEIIYRKFRKALKKGRAINKTSPDEDLHRLRIDCKKLRYIMEFFASLFQQKEMKKAIKQLKNLQNNLGDFNDLSVQQEMLKNYCSSLRPGSKKNQEVATAIGGLLTNLYHQQQGVREDFAEKFAEYSSPGNVARYKNLFKRRAEPR